MYEKNVKETVLWGLFYLCFAVVAVLLLLCVWGMFSRDFIRFFNHAIVVSALGMILLGLCVDALESAGATRKQTQHKRNTEHMMHFESKTIINKAGEIIIETFSEQEILALRKENEALQLAIQNLGHTIHEVEMQRAAEREGYRNQYNALLDKYERRDDDVRQYQRLFDSMREKRRAEEKEWRDRIEISHLEHMELRAWRKTEKARKKRDDKLRSRVQKIRKRKKVVGLVTAATVFAVASGVEREHNITDHHLEISNAVIALAEYLQPYDPSEELQIYLWDCRTAKALLNDIRSSVVKTAFGVEWENRILSGLVGLGIVPLADLVPIVTPAVNAPIAVDTPKSKGKIRGKKKRPAK